MTDTPARLLRLLSLLQNPREWPGSELADRLGVSPRTVRRDVDRLRGLGYPVEATLGAAGGYRLVAGAAMPPLLLDDEEAVAMVIGLRAAARQPVTGIGEASVRALGKLQQVLPARLRRRAAALTAATAPAPGWGQSTVDPKDLTVLAAAIATHERVTFHYTSPTGTRSRRLAEPAGLVVVGRHWYLVAYDNDRHAWRTFRADRLGRPESTGARFAPRTLPAPDPATYVTDTLYESAPTYRAVVTLHAPVARVAPGLGDAPGTLEAGDDGSCVWRSEADTLDWLAFRLVALGCEFTVREPAELVAHLRTLSARLARGAGD
ncbi:helix-turn-helix transcriptional regulator [Longispora urticae]